MNAARLHGPRLRARLNLFRRHSHQQAETSRQFVRPLLRRPTPPFAHPWRGVGTCARKTPLSLPLTIRARTALHQPALPSPAAPPR